MLDINHAEFIRNAREAYKRIGSIPCPAFGGEKIIFNKYGFNHLIRKGRIPRDSNEQMIRLGLLPHAAKIIRSATKYDAYRKEDKSIGKNVSFAHFWSLTDPVKQTRITVIVRQLQCGKKHFFSIF